MKHSLGQTMQHSHLPNFNDFGQRMAQKYINSENIKLTQKERKKNAPRKLPRRRPRALSYPLPPKPSKSLSIFIDLLKRPTHQGTYNQSQSLFARLPYEIREIIWFEFLGERILHIARTRGKLVAIACTNQEFRNHLCWGFIEGTAPGCCLSSIRPHHRQVDYVSLLRTCRLIYSEILPILYGSNVFDVNHIDTLLYLKRSVLLQRLNMIRKVTLTWNFKYYTNFAGAPYNTRTWREVCKVLSGFEGLQEVTMHLTGVVFNAGIYQWGLWRPVLDALKRVRPVRKFDVVLPWSEEDCMKVAAERGYSFRLMGRGV